VQSITSGDQDITDKVFDLRSDMTSIVVTYTDQPSVVSGTVTSSSGFATAAMVLAFPADTRQWRGYGASPRNLKSVVASATGAFTFEHLPAGKYYVIAVDPDEADNWKHPATLEALAKQATPLTIVAGESPRPLDLRLKTIR
jgi:hypothetical protein